MRTVLLLCCVLVAALWLAPLRVMAGDAADRAESLENALQAVEWYTNESVRKALQAESEGDAANAELYGRKAIESDLKAQGLRQEAANAWQAAGKPAQAKAAWQRAAGMARERADMLAKRVPPLLRQWQLASGSGNVAGEREHAILYFQAVYLTAQQWELVAGFSSEAGDDVQRQAALQQLQMMLASLRRTDRLDSLANDPRLASVRESVQRWSGLVAASH